MGKIGILSSYNLLCWKFLVSVEKWQLAAASSAFQTHM